MGRRSATVAVVEEILLVIYPIHRQLACAMILIVAIPHGPAHGQSDRQQDRVGRTLPQYAPAPTVPAEFAPADAPARTLPTLKERIISRVYQRDARDKADIPLMLSDTDKDVKITEVQVRHLLQQPLFRDNKIVGVPTGGPYSVTIFYEGGGQVGQVDLGPFYVGDLWVLAGQSNMEGVGDLADVTPPTDNVMLLGMNGKWTKASEPLHWLVDSPDPVHSGDPATREDRSTAQHKSRVKGAGLGLPFAAVMATTTGVPVGLVACAHGGTSMEQWNPAKKGDGGKSLYGSMLRQVTLAGGKVKGVLWYQGESDANPAAADVFQQKFTDLIDAVRADFGQPYLPFYYVQIGRYVRAADPSSWNKVQEIQRKLPETIPNTAVVSVLDLELDDGIHVGTQGLKRLGARLAKIALRDLFGRAGATTPTFDRVTKGPGNTLVVKFKNVNIAADSGVGPIKAETSELGVLVNLIKELKEQPDPLTTEQMVSGLKPTRHIAGFSLRKADGTEFPLVYEAMIGTSKEAVVLKLNGKLPEDVPLFLWYGWGYDPYCNLVDSADMAVPMFGPVALEGIK